MVSSMLSRRSVSVILYSEVGCLLFAVSYSIFPSDFWISKSMSSNWITLLVPGDFIDGGC